MMIDLGVFVNFLDEIIFVRIKSYGNKILRFIYFKIYFYGFDIFFFLLGIFIVIVKFSNVSIFV